MQAWTWDGNSISDSHIWLRYALNGDSIFLLVLLDLSWISQDIGLDVVMFLSCLQGLELEALLCSGSAPCLISRAAPLCDGAGGGQPSPDFIFLICT